MRQERLASLLKALGFVDCKDCKGGGRNLYSVNPPECATCEGSGFVRERPAAAVVIPHDDLRPEAP